jgi:hypothetical protein
LSEVAEENHNNKSGVPVIQPRIKYVVTWIRTYGVTDKSNRLSAVNF